MRYIDITININIIIIGNMFKSRLIQQFFQILPLLRMQSVSSSNFYNFSLIGRKEQDQQDNIQIPKMKMNYSEKLKIINSMMQKQKNIQTQIKFLREMFLTISKLRSLRKENFDDILGIFKLFQFERLKQTSLECIRMVSQVYLYLLNNREMLRADLKIENTIYESFIKVVGQETNIKQQKLIQISQLYRLVSKFKRAYLKDYHKIPDLVCQALKQSSKKRRHFNNSILFNILNGLSNRDLQLKKERRAMIFLISYLEKIYTTLSGQEKIRLAQQVINFNSEHRYGLFIKQASNILKYFLQELLAHRFNIWNTSIHTFICNTYPKSNEIICSISHYILEEAFSHLDAMGQINSLLTISHFLPIILQFSKKNTIDKLSLVQKDKLEQFVKRAVQIQDKENILQETFALILQNNFFPINNKTCLFLKQLSFLKLTPRLFFQLSRKGICLDAKYVGQSIQMIEAYKNINADELLIFSAVLMQSQLHPQDQQYKRFCNEYINSLRVVAKQNAGKLLHILAKMPQLVVYQLHRALNLQTFLELMAKQQLPKFISRMEYLYLMIKYVSVGNAQDAKWWKIEDIDNLVQQILFFQQKQTSSNHHSSNILTFFNKYLKNSMSKTEKPFVQRNVKKIIEYLIRITVDISEGRIAYQSAIYSRYWEVAFTLINKIALIMQVPSGYSYKFKTFLNIILSKEFEHFNNTFEYFVFVKKSLSIIENLKSQYQTIGLIIQRSIFLGLTDKNNVKTFENDFHLVRNEIKQIILIWLNKKQAQKCNYNIVKFMHQSKMYEDSELGELAQQFKTYGSKELIKIMEIFNLSVSIQSTKLYQSLLNQLKQRQDIHPTQVNFILITKNIQKYLKSSNKESVRILSTKVTNILKEVIKDQIKYFDEFTLEYHIAMIVLMGRLNVFSRDYERIMLRRVLNNASVNVLTEIYTINELIKNEFQFNYQQLRTIQQDMLLSKGSWSELYPLLKDKLLPEMKFSLQKHFKQYKDYQKDPYSYISRSSKGSFFIQKQ